LRLRFLRVACSETEDPSQPEQPPKAIANGLASIWSCSFCPPLLHPFAEKTMLIHDQQWNDAAQKWIWIV
jgi:hypothetical protein